MTQLHVPLLPRAISKNCQSFQDWNQQPRSKLPDIEGMGVSRAETPDSRRSKLWRINPQRLKEMSYVTAPG